MLQTFDCSREDNGSLDELICEALAKIRWLEIKRFCKLCNNASSPKRGQPGCDPACMHGRFLCDIIATNLNAVALQAGLDLCGDASSWPFAGFGEAKSCLTGLISNKPGVNGGGQIGMVTDTDRHRPRAFFHHHKLHNFDWTMAGLSEVKAMWLMPKPMWATPDAIDDAPNKPKTVFSKCPHMTWDNHFSGDVLMNFAAREGFGLTVTCRRDRLPKGTPTKFMCELGTNFRSKTEGSKIRVPCFSDKESGRN